MTGFAEREALYLRREQEGLMGQSTLAAARYVMKRNKGIDAVYLRIFDYKPNVTDNPEEVIPVDRATFMIGDPVGRHFYTMSSTENIALDSIVHLDPNSQEAQRLGSETANFAMMDLQVPVHDLAPELIGQQLQERVIPKFGGGILLQTGRSYHFLGNELFAPKDYFNYLSAWLLSEVVTQIHASLPRVHTPIADVRYVAHSMKRRTTGLRLTTRGRKIFEPRVIAFI